MTPAIFVKPNTIYVAEKYLGNNVSALLWVGHGYDPSDNDDNRVARTRNHMKEDFPHMPYGMWVGSDGKNDGPSAQPIAITSEQDGIMGKYYRFDISSWQEGTYRLNYHGEHDSDHTIGKPVKNRRDQEVFWPLWHIDDGYIDQDSWQATLPFVHQERNGAGYCFRILIWPNRKIEAFGDSV